MSESYTGTIQEAVNLINSDYQLWSTARSEDLGGGRVQKTLVLPWGIGETSVIMEGMNNAEGKRAAVGAYGEYIRGLVADATSEEEELARAIQASALAKQAGSELSAGREPVLDPSPAPEAVPGPSEEDEIPALADASLGETLITRRTALRSRVGRVEADLARWRKELKGIDAALAAMTEED